MSTWSNALSVIEQLKELKVDGPVTQEQGEQIARMLAGDRSLFIELDERPGQFDHDYAFGDWHWKLRQARNSCKRFFDILAEEERARAERRTLGELSALELLASAKQEALSLTESPTLRRLDADGRRMLKAYSGSIAARIAVAEDKLSLTYNDEGASDGAA